MNIDAFLHRVQTAVTSLKTMAGKIGEILCERVYGALERGIGRASLYDVQLAASRVWVGMNGASSAVSDSSPLHVKFLPAQTYMYIHTYKQIFILLSSYYTCVGLAFKSQQSLLAIPNMTS